jgi:hypothetical protein
MMSAELALGYSSFRELARMPEKKKKNLENKPLARDLKYGAAHYSASLSEKLQKFKMSNEKETT